MSNEASEVLKFEKEWLKHCNSYNDYVQESFKHIEEAITALSQTTCTDAISREDALKAFADYVASGYADSVEDFEEYSRIIAKLPAVRVAEKIGEWVIQDIHNCHTSFKCSKCGYIHDFMHLYGKPTADYTYCPSCGAKMAKEE